MKQFEEKTFTIPELKGISAKNIEEHLKLYSGYVKNANSILAKLPEYRGYTEADPFAPYVVGELSRRFSFEFDGMRNHEYYFKHFEGGSQMLAEGGALKKAIEEEFGSFDTWLANFKTLAMTRGVGWAMLVYDKASMRLLNNWNDEQHLGHLTGTSPVLALDMWEHSFVADYLPSGKKQYVEDFFTNVNWQNVEENFANATR
ncbi:MAG: manganese/iron superoxide dismutase-like protein superoxide dismutase, Fe-Mn family [Parcubacteria group bacterium]|nr:manganese/iron superoxide dismutase-like protein superoxide dismutase, Fe-Mn family [Parcubacteria group bacterium]